MADTPTLTHRPASNGKTPSATLDRLAAGLSIVIIIAATWFVHGGSLDDGLYLDDHWHRLWLQNDDWSPTALLHTTTIRPDQLFGAWWQEEPIYWQYLRPVAVLLAKIVYHFSDGNAKAWHAISLVLHVGTALMVHRLALWLTRRRIWALVGGLLFIVYSHNLYAVAWLAAQNTVLQTFLTLAALLVYIKASRLNVDAAEAKPKLRTGHVPGIKLPAFTCVVVLWTLALLSRENAIVLPAILVAFDGAFGGWAWLKRRWPAYGVFALVGGAYLLTRLVYLYHPMPDFYVRRPDGDWTGYTLWALAKLMHYLVATIWFSPMTIGPSGRYHPWREVPGDCLLMLGILIVLGGLYVLASRRIRGWWIWPLWIVLSVLPIVPLIATPHAGYMPSVGFAIGIVLAPGLCMAMPRGTVGRWSRWVALWFLMAVTSYLPIYHPMWHSHLAAERCTAQRIINDPPPASARDLFFINLPFTNVYIKYQLRRAWGLDPGPTDPDDFESFLGELGPSFDPGQLNAGPHDNFACHVLTFAPDVLRMAQPCNVEQLDASSFRVTIEGRAYFSGALGRFLIEGMRRSGPLGSGDVIEADGFEVAIERADADGVWQLRFRFPRPLADPSYSFYLATRRCSAIRLRFAGADELARSPTMLPAPIADRAELDKAIKAFQAGKARAGGRILATALEEPSEVRDAALTIYRQDIQPILAAVGLGELEFSESGDGHSTPGRARGLRTGWHHRVTDEVLMRLRRDGAHFAELRRARETLFAIRAVARKVIRTDLYLTGPPYPGPRPVDRTR